MLPLLEICVLSWMHIKKLNLSVIKHEHVLYRITFFSQKLEKNNTKMFWIINKILIFRTALKAKHVCSTLIVIYLRNFNL